MVNPGDFDYSNTGGLVDSRVSKRDHKSSSDTSAIGKPLPQKQVKIDESAEILKKDDDVGDPPDPTAPSSSGPPGPAAGGPPVLPIANEPVEDVSAQPELQDTPTTDNAQHFPTGS